MPRISGEDKQRSKEQLFMCVKRHHGLRESEIAEILHIHRRTVNNYLTELEREGKVYKEGVNWLADPDAGSWLRRFELAADEAFTLYLATRMFVKQSDKQNKTALSALSRLAEVLKTDLLVSDQIFDVAQELRTREKQPLYESHFTDLIRAYLRRHPVNISYRTAQGFEFDTTIRIYLIEPSAIGYTLYLIGHSSHVDDIRAYKIERITAVTVDKDSHYQIPVEYATPDVLKNAWSIISGTETKRIQLRFSKKVKARVLETNWHPTQEYEEEPDGSLLWWVDVASTIDMLPWIRGWGSDVEVLEPSSLRRQMKNEANRMTRLYKETEIMLVSPQLHHILYAKSYKETSTIHLLLYHLIDVGQVAQKLWQDVLTPSIRQQFAQWLQLTEDETGRFLSFLVALHDLGKASPAYQSKYAPEWLQTKLNDAGLLLNGKGEYLERTRTAPHGTVSTWALPAYLETVCQVSPRFARKIATAVGGHHGVWPGPRDTDFIDDSRYPAWQQARDELVQELVTVFKPPIVEAQLRGTQLNTFLTIFSGFTSVADWLGSREDAFPFEERPLSTLYYAQQAAEQAQQALQDLGWIGWQPNNSQQTFSEMFAYLNIKQPRTVQAEVIAAAQDASAPTLLILEAPTGIGKTETAFYLADTWLQKHQGCGLYIAMPTQATSNQMFDRTVEFLRQRYPADFVQINLAHGQWRMNDTLSEISLRNIGEDTDGRVAAMSWFMEKSKRALLAPFAVGTVDQALLSILQTKHFFVRLFGLAQKVVIFDEIHAYDTYMSTLFLRLLSWLHAIGASVILLSATLPSETRRKLIHAYSGQETNEPTDFYPALTLATDYSPPQILPLTAPEDSILHLNWLKNRGADEIVQHLNQALAKGGCAAVICNTVGRAQRLYQAVQEAQFDIDSDNLILFHARFPPIWRKTKEDAVKKKFGKDLAKRPFRAIVIATQVIEQSLDLDFDIMITDMAPIDLILQRAGRLHRHQRSDNQPRQHPRQLSIAPPDLDENRFLQWGNDGFVYEPYILLRSYLALQGSQTALSLPSQTVSLIESVYTADTPTHPEEKWQALLQETRNEMLRDQHHASVKAGRALIRAADDPDLLFDSRGDLAEDNPAIHETLQAKTRDIAPGIDIICLHQTPNGLLLDPDDPTTKVDLTQKPFGKNLKMLLNYKMTIQHWPTMQHCLQPEQEEQRPLPWQKNAILRRTHPIVFTNGQYHFNYYEKSYQLHIDRKLGLQWEVL